MFELTSPCHNAPLAPDDGLYAPLCSVPDCDVFYYPHQLIAPCGCGIHRLHRSLDKGPRGFVYGCQTCGAEWHADGSVKSMSPTWAAREGLCNAL